MKKLILPVFCGILSLWLLTGCGGTAENESASIPPAQSANDGLPTARTDDPGSETLPSPEAVPSEPSSSEVIFSTPAPAESVPGAPPSPEIDPPPSEVVASKRPGSDDSLTLIYQNPELPNGCEITSLAMLLAWAGYPVDKVELANYLPKQEFSISNGVRHGPDPNQAYAGDPASPNGWYCFEGPILEAANAYLTDQNTTQRAAPLSGATREELENYINDGIPLAVWVTLYYAAPKPPPSSFSWYLPDGSHYTPYSNLHCVVLAGWDGDNYRIANPMAGWESVSPDTFWNCFSAMGCRAVAILP